ncbi:MAG: hypothetical protein ACI9LG_001914 [Moritella dasanensis]|jgi:hypothetical protein
MGNLNINVATGRAGNGDNAHWFGGAAKYKAFDAITFHATFEYGNNRKVSDEVKPGFEFDPVTGNPKALVPKDAVVTDTLAYLVGF